MPPVWRSPPKVGCLRPAGARRCRRDCLRDRSTSTTAPTALRRARPSDAPRPTRRNRSTSRPRDPHGTVRSRCWACRSGRGSVRKWKNIAKPSGGRAETKAISGVDVSSVPPNAADQNWASAGGSCFDVDRSERHVRRESGIGHGPTLRTRWRRPEGLGLLPGVRRGPPVHDGTMPQRGACRRRTRDDAAHPPARSPTSRSSSPRRFLVTRTFAFELAMRFLLGFRLLQRSALSARKHMGLSRMEEHHDRRAGWLDRLRSSSWPEIRTCSPKAHDHPMGRGTPRVRLLDPA